GKGSGDVLDAGDELQDVRRQQLEHAFAAGARGVGAGAGDLPAGTVCVWRGGRILCGRGAGYVAGAVYIYALSDSRGAGCAVVDAGVPAVFAVAGRRASFAADVLGICGGLRAECADQGADRTGVSSGRDWALSAADGKFAAS